jgi:hypothetical protein
MNAGASNERGQVTQRARARPLTASHARFASSGTLRGRAGPWGPVAAFEFSAGGGCGNGSRVASRVLLRVHADSARYRARVYARGSDSDSQASVLRSQA